MKKKKKKKLPYKVESLDCCSVTGKVGKISFSRRRIVDIPDWGWWE